MPATTPPTAHARTAILVLGMHRSGTSAVARLLNLRGAALGRDLLPPKDDNERGFWENRAIVALHERYLSRRNVRWHDLIEPGDDGRGAAAHEFVADLPGVLAEQFAAAPLILVKDPRLSLVAPLWNEALAALAIRPVFVITIRHPQEVAASLARRDGLPVVQSQLLWLQHLVEAERATRGHARVFVHYERLLSDWRGELARITSALDIGWPDPPAEFEAAVSAFIAPALRHHDAGQAAALPAILARAYAAACTAAGAGATDAFSAVGGEYDELMQLAAPLQRALAEREANAEACHTDEIARARLNGDDLANQLAAARSNIEALLAQLDRARDAVARKDAELDGARSHVDGLVRELATSRAVVAAKDEEIGAARRNIDALATELAQARDNSHALALEIALKSGELDEARASIDRLAADIARARESQALKEREVDAARGNIDALVAQIDAARSNIDGLVAEIQQARQAHALRDATEAALRGELQALRQSRWFRLGRRLRVIGGPPA